MAITRPELLELKNCELYDFEGEPLEHEGCDDCLNCTVCWYCECDSYEEALEFHIDRQLAGRQAPIKLIDGKAY